METKVHDDITIEFDDFDPKQVKRVDLCSIMNKDIVPDDHLVPDDGYVLYGLFSEDECRRMIEATNSIGYEELIGYDKSNRSNKRIKCQSTTIVKELERRINQFIEHTVHINEDTKTMFASKFHYGEWRYTGLNPILRFCRYDKDDKFMRHYDYGFNPDPLTHRTLKTCMLYLNSEFKGGHTRYFYHGTDEHGNVNIQPYINLKPTPGMCLIFNQNILHDGETVSEGEKYMVRTDMFYKAEHLINKPTHNETRAMALYEKGQQCEETGELEMAGKLYTEAFELFEDINLLYE